MGEFRKRVYEEALQIRIDAADLVTVPCLHSLLIADAAAIPFTKRFLKEGRFREDGEKHSIPKEQPAATEENAAR